jgi:hypothetical protein
MRTVWIPVVIGAVAGAFGCNVLYRISSGPAFFAEGDILARLGTTLISLSGAVCGALGALVRVQGRVQEIWRRFVGKTTEDRAEFWFVVVASIVLLAFFVEEMVRGKRLRVSGYFWLPAALIGVAVRWIYD